VPDVLQCGPCLGQVCWPSVAVLAIGKGFPFHSEGAGGLAMKWGLILFRGSALAVLALIGSSFIATACWRAAATSPQHLASFATYGDYVFYAGGLAALVLYARFAWHLRSWETGAADPCGRCGGPLGRLRPGKKYFGRQLGEYRTCYNCSTHSAALPQ
jgi:hypothetical protein